MSILVLVADELFLPAELEAAWLAELPPARRAALAKRPGTRGRHQSLIASRLLAQCLRRFGHGGDVLASLRYPARGRPTLDLPVDFSLSHCEGRVLCAASTSGPVGVDVEAVAPLLAADFPLYLNAGERAWAGGDARRFHSIWTRKEAVAKAAGSRGLADVAKVDTGGAGARAALAGRIWETVELPVGASHVAHLAMRPGIGGHAAFAVEPVSSDGLRMALRAQASPAS